MSKAGITKAWQCVEFNSYFWGKSIQQIFKYGIPVNGEVQPHEFGEHGVFVSDHGGVVVGPILFRVDGAGGGALTEQVVVDGGGDDGKLGDQVH